VGGRPGQASVFVLLIFYCRSCTSSLFVTQVNLIYEALALRLPCALPVVPGGPFASRLDAQHARLCTLGPLSGAALASVADPALGTRAPVDAVIGCPFDAEQLDDEEVARLSALVPVQPPPLPSLQSSAPVPPSQGDVASEPFPRMPVEPNEPPAVPHASRSIPDETAEASIAREYDRFYGLAIERAGSRASSAPVIALARKWAETKTRQWALDVARLPSELVDSALQAMKLAEAPRSSSPTVSKNDAKTALPPMSALSQFLQQPPPTQTSLPSNVAGGEAQGSQPEHSYFPSSYPADDPLAAAVVAKRPDSVTSAASSASSTGSMLPAILAKQSGRPVVSVKPDLVKSSFRVLPDGSADLPSDAHSPVAAAPVPRYAHDAPVLQFEAEPLESVVPPEGPALAAVMTPAYFPADAACSLQVVETSLPITAPRESDLDRTSQLEPSENLQQLLSPPSEPPLRLATGHIRSVAGSRTLEGIASDAVSQSNVIPEKPAIAEQNGSTSAISALEDASARMKIEEELSWHRDVLLAAARHVSVSLPPVSSTFSISAQTRQIAAAQLPHGSSPAPPRVMRGSTGDSLPTAALPLHSTGLKSLALPPSAQAAVPPLPPASSKSNGIAPAGVAVQAPPPRGSFAVQLHGRIVHAGLIPEPSAALPDNAALCWSAPGAWPHALDGGVKLSDVSAVHLRVPSQNGGPLSLQLRLSPTRLPAAVQRSGGLLVVELTPADASDGAAAALRELGGRVSALHGRLLLAILSGGNSGGGTPSPHGRGFGSPVRTPEEAFSQSAAFAAAAQRLTAQVLTGTGTPAAHTSSSVAHPDPPAPPQPIEASVQVQPAAVSASGVSATGLSRTATRLLAARGVGSTGALAQILSSRNSTPLTR
jgi:hypothetical protein